MLVVKAIGLDDIPDDVDLALVCLLEVPHLALQVAAFGLSPDDLQPRPSPDAPETDRSLAQAVAQCVHYELR